MCNTAIQEFHYKISRTSTKVAGYSRLLFILITDSELYNGNKHILHELCPRVGRMWLGVLFRALILLVGVGHRDLRVRSAASGRLTYINQISNIQGMRSNSPKTVITLFRRPCYQCEILISYSCHAVPVVILRWQVPNY